MANFYIPLSGLQADTTALNTIANDLANLNTTGYKAQTVNFSDMFYQQIGEQGSGDLIQAGSGVGVSSIQSDFSQGSTIATTASGDVELDGNGFFVVKDGATDVYTRDGTFSTNSSGELMTQNGLQVQGYPAVNGVVNTNGTLTGITLPVGQVEAAKASTSFGVTANLNSSGVVGATSGTVSNSVTLYDSLGVSHAATITYTKTANNTWNYSISMPDTLTPTSSTTAGVTTTKFGFGGTVDPSTNLTITGLNSSNASVTITAPTVVAGETAATYTTALNAALTAAGITPASATVTSSASGITVTGNSFSTSGSVIQDPVSANTTGTLTFDSSGNLTNPTGDISGISFQGLSDGSANMTMSWNILGTAGTPTITQNSEASTQTGSTQNGYTAGTYTSFAIAADGTVNASFTNGQTQAVGQLALASVANQQGLQLLGNNQFATTTASGVATDGVSGTNGLGTITDDALEASNVNISAEFSDLIIAQRAFEANSKGITTFDTISQDTIGMIR
jgi:flagellar hook protein FlgE